MLCLALLEAENFRKLEKDQRRLWKLRRNRVSDGKKKFVFYFSQSVSSQKSEVFQRSLELSKVKNKERMISSEKSVTVFRGVCSFI